MTSDKQRRRTVSDGNDYVTHVSEYWTGTLSWNIDTWTSVFDNFLSKLMYFRQW